jgi:transaldolase/glucose-6-phosphate isomerase
MMRNPIAEVTRLGQSIWYDYIRRGLLDSGELARLVEEGDVRGVTSNPAIFEKAIAGSSDYDDAIRKLLVEGDRDAKKLFEILAIEDVQCAADILRPLYDQSAGRDGYVSLEVSPHLARDVETTVEEACRLWGMIARPNAMIKIPATEQGIAALPKLVLAGVNTNLTLLFSRRTFERVALAFQDGLEQRVQAGFDLSRVSSVASFFVSRIDSAIAASLGSRMPGSLRGKVAIANAKLAYARWKELFATPRWAALATLGARSLRLLWASTGSKDPTLRDVWYIEELIGPNTVNTVPVATLDAFRQHGVARPTLEADLDGAKRTLDSLSDFGISLDEVCTRLLEQGLTLFNDAFDRMLGAVEQKRQAALGPLINRQRTSLPATLQRRVADTLANWTQDGKLRRLWARDSSLWTGSDEANWMGWLDVADDQLAHRAAFDQAASDAKEQNPSHVVVLGMGGSSLCPDVLRATFGKILGWPELVVLDSTDPAQIANVEARIDPTRSLFLVSSKSGTTLEPNLFMQYFLHRVADAVGTEKAPRRFAAITDPESALEREARARSFRAIYHGYASIGGRYSALSNFGMVPAALMGLDAPEFIERAGRMLHACASSVPVEQNPGVGLGVVMGEAAKGGRDKLTIVASERIASFGAWLEQLVAESTGKGGKGIIPIDREGVGAPAVYGEDRLFVYLRLYDESSADLDARMVALERAGQPVVTISIASPMDLGEEFFRWEMATAVAGSVLGINPFDQPDVEASKIATRKLTEEYEETGRLPAETPFFEEHGLKLYADAGNMRSLGRRSSLVEYLAAHLARLGVGDYFGVLAYVPMIAAHDVHLQAMRHRVRDARRVATCLGYGPRFLHSTGQAYKGGPNSGVFLQVTCEDARDLRIPKRRLSFGVVKAAQARGDFDVLTERHRRALRIHLGPDVSGGLALLRAAVEQALA